MNKKMSRYKGLILSCVSMMMIVVCVCSFSFESKANDMYIFHKQYAEPSYSDSSGYITLLWRHGKGGPLYTSTFFWNTYGVNKDGSSAPVYAYINLTSTTFEFTVSGANTTDTAIYNLFYVNSSYHHVKSSNTSRYTWNMYETDNIILLGWQAKGNIGVVNSSFTNQGFVCYYNNDSSAYYLKDIIDTLLLSHNVNVNIYNAVCSILNSVDGVENQLSSVVSYLKSVDSNLTDIKTELQDIYDKVDDLLEEQKKSNTWLEKIWISIQEFFTPDEKDKEESDKLESETNDKTDKLDDLNEQNKTDKVDVDNSSDLVDENVDLESIGTVNNIFVYITENEYILQMLLMVFSVALVAYVLFGKK